MPAPNEMTLEELETEIQTLSSLKRTEFKYSEFRVTSTIRPLIQAWLIKSGMNERKVLTASNLVLANAYAIGTPYINKVNADGQERRFGASKRGVKGVDIDLDDEDAKNLLKKQMDELESPERPTPTPTPIHSPIAEHPNAPTPPIDQAAIARAAASVIRPRLDEAKNELKREIQTQILRAYDSFMLSDSTKAEIAAEASRVADEHLSKMTSIAQKAIEKLENMLPREIIIKTPEGGVKLPAGHRHYLFDEIIRDLSAGEHIYLVGGAGTGKTHLFKQTAEALGYNLETEFFPIDQSLTKYDVKGYKSPLGEYVATSVYKAVKFGGYMAIDEADMWAAAALGSLNSVLANDYGAFGDEMVKVHPRFRCVIAANTFGFGATQQFQGRNPLDAASLDRFTYHVCDYDEDLERALYGDTPWTAYVHRVRKAVSQLSLQHIVSMRAIARGKKFLDQGQDPDSVCRKALWRNLPPDTVSKIKAISGEFGKLREVA